VGVGDTGEQAAIKPEIKTIDVTGPIRSLTYFLISDTPAL
jgi:hypothetical protein